MRKKEKLLLFLLILMSFIEFSANIWGISIYSLDESKNATCAREMIQRGDYIVPTFNYELRTDKPPMHYYFMIIAYKLFGINEFSARFFSAVFGTLTVLITYLFARRILGVKVAFLSSIVLVSSFHTALQFHMAVPDPYLIFYINAVFFSFYIWFKEGRNLFLYLMYISMGLGVLTKGPVAVVLPSLIVLIYLIYMRSLNVKTLSNMKIIRGFFIITFISLPWYIAVGIKTDWIWVYEFLFKHNIGRFSKPMEGHGGSFLLPSIFVFFGLFPFSVFIIQSLFVSWKDKFKDVLVYLLIVSLVYVGFFSLSGTKLPNYTVPSYPALSIILGYFLSKLNPSNIKKLKISLSIIVYILISIVVSAVSFLALKNDKVLSDLSYLSLFFLVWTVGGFLALLFVKLKDIALSIASLSFFSVIFTLIFFFYTFPKIDSRNPVVNMLPLIDRDKPVAYYRGFNPSFAFYLGTPIPKLKTPEEVKNFLSKNQKVFIITRKRYLKDLKGIKNLKILSIRKDLFEKTTSVLISNREP